MPHERFPLSSSTHQKSTRKYTVYIVIKVPRMARKYRTYQKRLFLNWQKQLELRREYHVTWNTMTNRLLRQKQYRLL